MSDPIVLFERVGSTGFVTLNRPDQMNAISLETRRVLPEVLRQAEQDPEVRVIVLRGAGERAFSAGADIKEFAPAASLSAARLLREPPQWNDVIAALIKPTLASIQGICLGGGLETALACDVRIAADDAVFGLPEVRLAILPGAGGTQRLARVVGVGHAMRMILTGDRIDAAEAYRIGLISEVVPKANLAARTLEWSAKLSEGGPLAVRYAKEAIRRGSEMPLADGLRLESDLQVLLTNTKDRIEGATAFKEKRKPRYQGE